MVKLTLVSESGTTSYTSSPLFSVLPFLQGTCVARFRWSVFDVVGGGDLQGRGRGLHGGGAGAAGLCPEAAVPGSNAGELPEPGLSG